MWYSFTDPNESCINPTSNYYQSPGESLIVGDHISEKKILGKIPPHCSDSSCIKTRPISEKKILEKFGIILIFVF